MKKLSALLLNSLVLFLSYACNRQAVTKENAVGVAYDGVSPSEKTPSADANAKIGDKVTTRSYDVRALLDRPDAVTPLADLLMRNVVLASFKLINELKDERSYFTITKEELLADEAYDLVELLYALINDDSRDGLDLSSDDYRELIAAAKFTRISLGDFGQKSPPTGTTSALLEIESDAVQIAKIDDETSLVAATKFGISSFNAETTSLDVYGLSLVRGTKSDQITALIRSSDDVMVAKLGTSENAESYRFSKAEIFSLLIEFAYEKPPSAESAAAVKPSAFSIASDGFALQNNASYLASYLRLLRYLGSTGSVFRLRRAFLVERSETFKTIYESKIVPVLTSLGVDASKNRIEAVAIKVDSIGFTTNEALTIQQGSDVTMTFPTQFDLQFAPDPTLLNVVGVSGVKKAVFLNKDATLSLESLRVDTNTNEIELTIVGSFKVIFFDKTQREYVRYNLNF